MLSEISQVQNDNCCMISLICRDSSLFKIFNLVFIETTFLFCTHIWSLCIICNFIITLYSKLANIGSRTNTVDLLSRLNKEAYTVLREQKRPLIQKVYYKRNSWSQNLLPRVHDKFFLVPWPLLYFSIHLLPWLRSIPSVKYSFKISQYHVLNTVDPWTTQIWTV